MITYTIEEAIEEMKSTVQVFSDGYGTWKVKANIGRRSTGEYAEDNAIWSDSANEDNYESPDERNQRAARNIIESWVNDNNCPDNVVVTADNSTIYVLNEDEKEFAESETANLAMLVDGRSKAFIDAYDNREDA